MRIAYTTSSGNRGGLRPADLALPCGNFTCWVRTDRGGHMTGIEQGTRRPLAMTSPTPSRSSRNKAPAPDQPSPAS